MDMNEEALDNFLMHYGVKGMKWGKHASKADYKSSVKSHRKELYKGLGETYSKKRNIGVLGAAAFAGAGTQLVGAQMMRSAGYSKGKSFAMAMIGGAPGAALAIELKARRMAKED
jgi:hypothetical protein